MDPLRARAARPILAVGALLAMAIPALATEDRPWMSLEEAVAASAPAGDRDGGFEASIFLHAQNLEGTLEARGRRSDFDASFNDLLDFLNFGGGVRLSKEGEGRVGFFASAEVYDLEAERDTFFGEIESGLTFFFGSGGVSWRLGDGSGPLEARLLGGVRYGYVGLEIDADPGPDGSWHKDWIDALVGVEAELDLSDAVSLWVHADAGGFGIGSSSELSSDVTAALGWNIAPSLELSFGYRVFYLVYQGHEGATQNSIRQVASGPYLSLTFEF